jgi:hypothetical protein
MSFPVRGMLLGVGSEGEVRLRKSDGEKPALAA